MDRHNNKSDIPGVGEASPFSLGSETFYRLWREAKLANSPRNLDEIRVPVRDLAAPGTAERAQILRSIARCNMAIYVSQSASTDESSPARRQDLTGFLAAFGLRSVEKHRSAEDDGFVAIEVSPMPAKRSFIPYTSRSMNWHTDGYYAAPSEAIRAMLMHCVRSATTGGENALLDPEIAYIRLRDASPKWIAALMHPGAMTIPASIEEDGSERPVSIGPVFAIDPRDGNLQMRYTARGRNISWRDDADTRAAATFLEYLLKEGDEPLILKARLSPGEGLICNNVLHTRTAFNEEAGSGRLHYRARFATRVAGTIPVHDSSVGLNFINRNGNHQ